MLALMLGFGIISRVASGWLSDRIGGLRTLLLGSTLQCLVLAWFCRADSLPMLYARVHRLRPRPRAASCRPTP